MDLGLKNKTALITGGTSGIGLAIAKRLGQEGCKVIVCGRDESRLDKAIEDLKSMGFYPGPNFKVILSAVMAATLDNRITSVEEAKAFVRNFF